MMYCKFKFFIQDTLKFTYLTGTDSILTPFLFNITIEQGQIAEAETVLYFLKASFVRYDLKNNIHQSS